MPRRGDQESQERFAAFIDALASVIGHADRAAPLRHYCTGLLMPAERKSVEPMAAVSLSVANSEASLPVAYRLYLPQDWAVDPVRLAKAGVPGSITFQTKPEIALDQIRAALEAQIPRGVVLMDAGYGSDTALRTGVSALGLAYVAGVQPHNSVWTRTNPPPQVKPWSGRGRPPTRLRRGPHHQPQSAKEIARSLPSDAWITITWRG